MPHAYRAARSIPLNSYRASRSVSLMHDADAQRTPSDRQRLVGSPTAQGVFYVSHEKAATDGPGRSAAHVVVGSDDRCVLGVRPTRLVRSTGRLV